jgi:hypothetical protein
MDIRAQKAEVDRIQAERAAANRRIAEALPSAIEFCLAVPLYRKYQLPSTREAAHFLILNDQTLDCYCSDCKQHSVFQRVGRPAPGALNGESPTPPFSVNFACSRNPKHHLLRFFFLVDDDQIQKIGQSPSLADLGRPDLDKYRNLLKADYKELTKAVGLAAHGVGAGALVYLRRIFERLIAATADKMAHTSGWDEDGFRAARMEEKILSLSDQLPPFLVDNRSIYGIMSSGIHNLTEDECLQLFPTVRIGIELILDDVLRKREEEEKIRNATNAIGALSGELKNR